MRIPQPEAVILDWAGTTIDFGSLAPAATFVEAFRSAFDFELSLDEARKPMGLGKREHFEALAQDPSVAERWRTRFGRQIGETDIDRLYEAFVPRQIERARAHAELIPGTLEAIATLRHRGMKVGTTTGYPRAVMDALMPLAAEHGYRPDCTVCGDQLGAGGRPGPWMALQCVIELAIGSVARCVKVDDTLPGIAEGLNAGMWTVGLALSGSMASLSLAEYHESAPERLATIRAAATANFTRAGAHYVIDTIATLPSVIDDIAARLARGERP